MTERRKHDLTGLPHWAVQRIERCPVDIDQIWSDWTDNLPIAFSKRAAFVASTKQTIHGAGFLYSDKTIGMLTDALLTYYTMPGRSDLEHPSKGFYGWTAREQEIAA